MRKAAVFSALMLIGCAEDNVENAVRESMKDPASAQFREIERCRENKEMWIGEVNAKNSFGAYTGFTIFFYDGDEVFLPEHPRFEGAATRCIGVDGAALARDLIARRSQI